MTSEPEVAPSPSETPDSPATFADFNLRPELARAVSGLGYETPTPIQQAAIPVMLEGHDVVALASTGTGKTAAFALPVLTRLAGSEQRGSGRSPRALVLTPTRELALQVCEAFEAYATQLENLTLLPIYGGQGYGVQLGALKRGVDVVVGTPGRIIDHVGSGRLDLSQIDMVVLDEADEMLTMGFEEEVEQILGHTPETKQVALFSATMPPRIRKLASQYLRDPQEIRVQSSAVSRPQITQRYLVVNHAAKVDALTRVLEIVNFDGLIIFARTKNSTEVLAEKLRARGYTAAPLNGDIPQAHRERTVEQFKAGVLDILVATDVAARGLDVERVSHVLNIDVPTDIQSYTHRIGRTGRAGRSGEAITFVTPRERYFVGQMRKVASGDLEQMAMPTVAEINSTRLSRFDDAITAALGQHERMEEFRAITAHYVTHHDVPEADVAAALAIVAQGDDSLLLDESAELRSPDLAAAGAGGKSKDKSGRSRGRGGADGHVAYRVEVGHRHQVSPRHIMGALANEGGLGKDDFGQIDIHQTFSLVHLRRELSEEQRRKLRSTRVSGRLIDIKADEGSPGGRPRREASRAERSNFGSRSNRDRRPARGDTARGNSGRGEPGRSGGGREYSSRNDDSSWGDKSPRHDKAGGGKRHHGGSDRSGSDQPYRSKKSRGQGY